jgi:putative FmdB family regulatory protein
VPIYKYECPECGADHDELKPVSERATDECPECGATAKLAIVPVHLDYLKCGWDLGFPTAASKWTKMQNRKNSGKTWDSNNLRYGGEHERKK